MAVTDLKVTLRKRGATGFDSDGSRLLPVTKPEYILGLLGADGRFDPKFIPAFLYDGREYLGILDLDEQSTIDIDGLVSGNWAAADATAQGSYLEVTTAGWLTNTTGNSADYEIIGTGDEGDTTFPIHLEEGDYLVLARYNSSSPHYSFAIVNRSYQIADTAQYGITKLYDGVDSDSTVFAATAHAVKVTNILAAAALPKTGGTLTGPLTMYNQHIAFTDGGDEIKLSRNAGKLYITDAGEISHAIILEGDSRLTDSRTPISHVHDTSEIPHYDGADLQYINIAEQDNKTLNAVLLALDQFLYDHNDLITTNAVSISNVAKEGLKYYTSVSNADAGGHVEGNIVAVLEA